jgi:hypothetical protein
LETIMRSRRTSVSLALAALAAGLFATVPSSAVAADPCVSGADVREQVHALIASLRDDVHSRDARAATRLAMIESLHAYRGHKATTAEERKQLGQEISALARQQRNADTRLEGKALAAAILALIEQRETGRFTAAERHDLRLADAAVRRAAVAKTDHRVEGQRVAEAFRALHAQFVCTP